jgi:hypothetical protein
MLKVNECEQYKLDLTDYATGDMTFLTKKKQQKLFEHLRKCSECLDKFFDYERIYATSASMAQSQNPEFRRRMDALIEQFKSSAQVKPAPTDIKIEIDSAAERIHTWVKENGKTVLPVLREKTDLLDYPFYEAMGVLITREKIIVGKGEDNRPNYVSPR